MKTTALTIWPGNVRELRNTIERLRFLNSDKLFYDAPDLDAALPGGARPGGEPVPAAPAEPAAAAAAATPVSSGKEGAGELNPRTAFRRLDRLRELFRKHGKLNRAEVARLLGISLVTATRDLRTLCTEGLVEKVTPGRSPRSHYFRLRSASP